jgi:integrase/recombinase XerD
MAGLRPPHVAVKPVPVFTSRELARLERACAGRGFAERRDAAVIALLRASGIRLSELAGIRYDPGDMRRSDVDLLEREVTVLGKGRRTRTVKIGYDAARSLDRYLRARARHPLARRPLPATRSPAARSCGSAPGTGGRSPPAASTRRSPAAAGRPG